MFYYVSFLFMPAKNKCSSREETRELHLAEFNHNKKQILSSLLLKLVISVKRRNCILYCKVTTIFLYTQNISQYFFRCIRKFLKNRTFSEMFRKCSLSSVSQLFGIGFVAFVSSRKSDLPSLRKILKIDTFSLLGLL